MRKTSLAFISLAFIGYWLSMAEPSGDRTASLNPVMPSIVRMLPFQKTVHERPDITGIRQWLSSEAQKVGRVDGNPSSTVMRLKKKALALKVGELETLKVTALSPDSGGDDRFLAVYIIGLSESAAARDFLKEIGRSPVPSSPNDRSYSDEVVIRAHALEAVVRRLSPVESGKYLQDVLSKTTDPAVARHARYWLNRRE